MKKLILLASAALTFGGVAYAQDASTAPATGTTNPDAASQPAGAPDMGAQPPAGGTPDMGAQPSAPGGSPDASGGMQPPAAGGDMSGGAQGGAGMAPGSATGPNGPISTTPTQGATNLPTCSKTVTDNCKQGAGSGKSGGHHRAMRHHRRK
jgi:hypothetical protein